MNSNAASARCYRYHFFDVVREHVAHMDDDKKDWYEEKWDEDRFSVFSGRIRSRACRPRRQEREAKGCGGVWPWWQETEEAENDVAGLSLSFLTVQATQTQRAFFARSRLGTIQYGGLALCHQRHTSQPGGHGAKMSCTCKTDACGCRVGRLKSTWRLDGARVIFKDKVPLPVLFHFEAVKLYPKQHRWNADVWTGETNRTTAGCPLSDQGNQDSTQFSLSLAKALRAGLMPFRTLRGTWQLSDLEGPANFKPPEKLSMFVVLVLTVLALT